LTPRITPDLREGPLEYDKDNVDEMTLALLYLGLRGRSAALTEEGQRRSEELFRKYFT